MTVKQLKGVILSVEDTLLNTGKIKQDVFDEVKKLMTLFKLRGIKPVLLANQQRDITLKSGEEVDLHDALEKEFDDLKVFAVHRTREVPYKPYAASTAYVLDKMGWESNEVVYIGSSEHDMKTAVNGKLLFLRATWYSNNTDYGFQFDTPKEMGRFIDTLCRRDHFWSHKIIDGNFEYYALAPFSTYKAEFSKYSENARAAAKFGKGNVDFWLGALVTSLYFTGIHKQINFITSYPGHAAGFDNDKMSDDLETFGDCFRKNYLPDLIVRHKTAKKSQTARIEGTQIDHHNQLNTIKLNRSPMKTKTERYKASPLGKNKTLLLVDDICTKGWSLDAARKYIDQTGTKTIMVTWLKTINTNYYSIGETGKFNPYQEQNFVNIPTGKEYNYQTYLVDCNASEELGEQLEQYLNWDWPV